MNATDGAPSRARGARASHVTDAAALGRARRWLDQNLFPEPPPPPRITWRRASVIAALAVAAVAIQLARMWPSAPLNSIWFEDANTYLVDAMSRGFLDALTTPYFGYVQMSNRLVAEPVAQLPIEWFAAAMAIAAAAITTGCAFVVWRASAGHIENQYLRATLAAMVIFLPIFSVEMLDTVTTTVWFLLFASFWVLLWRPATFARAIGAACFLLLSGVSNAGMIFLFPLWLLRLIAIRDRRDVVMVAAYAVGVSVLVGLSWNDRNLLGEKGVQGFIQLTAAPHWDWSLVPAYAQRVVGGAFMGQRINGFLWANLGVSFEVALGLLLVALIALSLARASARLRVLVPLAVAISLALFLAAGYGRWVEAGRAFLWPNGASNSGASHYMVVPTLLLLSAVILCLDARPRSVSANVWGRLQAGAVLFMALVALANFNVANVAVRGSPTWSEALDQGRSQCVRTHAPAVKVKVASEWRGGLSMTIACTELDGSTPASARFGTRSRSTTRHSSARISPSRRPA
jgi:hypothetical protein